MNAPLPTSVRQQRAGERAALLRMVVTVLLIGALVPWLANAYWIKTLTSALALALAAAGVALLYGQLGLVICVALPLPNAVVLLVPNGLEDELIIAVNEFGLMQFVRLVLARCNVAGLLLLAPRVE